MDDRVDSISSGITFVDLLVAIIVGWLLVAVWQRALENFCYGTLKLNRDSTFQTVIVAIVMTLIFIGYTVLSQNITAPIVEKTIYPQNIKEIK